VARLAISQTPDAIPIPPTFEQAFRVWCKVAALSFGGPAGQIAVMHLASAVVGLLYVTYPWTAS
jgi:hypothetical protein